MNKRVYLDAVKFKTKDEEYLGILLIFTPISLDAQEVWSLNQLCVYILERIKECVSPLHTSHFIFMKFCIFLST